MKTPLVFLVVLPLLLGFRLTAAGQEVGLREPLLAEFLAAIPAITLKTADEAEKTFDLQKVVAQELRTRYPAEAFYQQPFELLKTAYDALRVNSFMTNPSSEEIHFWNQALVMAWLNENDADIAELDHIPDLVETIIPRDFNADGIDEYLLKISVGTWGYELVQWDGDDYRWIDVPLPFGLQDIAYHSPHAGWFEEYGFSDINGDGLPDWQVLYGGYGCFGCTASYGTLYVLSWGSGQLKATYESHFSQPSSWYTRPETIDWDFGDRHIRQLQMKYDNWGCHWSDEKIHRWDEAQALYMPESQSIEYERSVGCALRMAESAMWAEEYGGAAFLYELAFERLEDTPDYGRAELRQYAQARLALAYTMIGEHRLAAEVIELLETESPASEMILAMTDDLQNAPDAYRTCAALFNTFYQYADIAGSYYYVPGGLELGRTFDNNFPNRFQSHALIPENAGCDIGAYLTGLQDQIEAICLSPGELLSGEDRTRLGFQIAAAVHADLNGDERDEWLLWPTAPVEPVFLAPRDDYGCVDMSRPALESREAISSITSVTLPDGQRVFAELSTETNDFRDNTGNPVIYHCPPRENWSLPVAALNLWQLQDEQLVKIFSAPLCEPRSVTQLFTNVRETLRGWVPNEMVVRPGRDTVYLEEGTYTWDGNIYSPPALPDSAISSEPIPTAPSWSSDFPGTATYRASATHYRQALAYERTGDVEAAAREYAAIYEAAPDTSWGMLAALHLELPDE